MLPTFLIIGAAKSGTTSLSAYLNSHPEVFMTEPKEPHFFSHGRGRDLAGYKRLFEGANACTVRGEASTSYSQAPRCDGVPERIAELVPSVKLIYLLRNPVDRIRSQYTHYVDRGREKLPLERAVLENPEYVAASRYADQIELYLRHFSRESLLILSTDDLRDARADVMRRTFAFLDVDPDVALHALDVEVNRSADKRRTSAAMDMGRRMVRRSGLSKRVPRNLLKATHKALSRPISAESMRISPVLEEQLWNRLGDDVARLRTMVGPEFDLWGRA